MTPQPVLDYIAGHEGAFLEALFSLLRQPSVSAEGVGIAECARMVEGCMAAAGLENVRALVAPGNPFVYGEWLHAPGAPTILFYGHYDVQPASAVEWRSDPFEPVVRNGRVYARGAGDNKGQFFAHLCAIEAYLRTVGALPVNVKVLLEGEEEIGSPHLDAVVRDHRALFDADLAYTSDGAMHESRRATAYGGVRGILYFDVKAVGADRDHHSGNKGNLIPNAAWRVVEFLSSLRDPATGRVVLDDFYTDVRPTSAVDRSLLRAIPYDEHQVARDHGLANLNGLTGEELYHRVMLEPALNICGLHSGVEGVGMRTTIPHVAHAKVDIRLVADQDPDRIWASCVRHARRVAPDVELTRVASMRPSRTPVDRPLVRLVVQALRDASDGEPLVMPSLGGSLPDHVFTSTLELDSIIVPYANADQGNHGPNENLSLDLFLRGIRTTSSVMAALGDGPRPPAGIAPP